MSEFRTDFDAKRMNSHAAAGYCNESTYHKRFDLMWNLDRAREDKKKIDMTEFGFKEAGPNAYSIKSPEWIDYSLVLMPWQTPSAFEADAQELLARGFRNSDVVLLRNYLSTASYEVVQLRNSRKLMDQMGQTVRERRKGGADITSEEIAAFEYRRQWNNANARRAWACGMFDVLDHQRQRILASALEEMSFGEFTVVISTPENPQERDKTIKDSLATGDYAAGFDRREKELQKGAQR